MCVDEVQLQVGQVGCQSCEQSISFHKIKQIITRFFIFQHRSHTRAIYSFLQMLNMLAGMVLNIPLSAAFVHCCQDVMYKWSVLCVDLSDLFIVLSNLCNSVAYNSYLYYHLCSIF